MEVPALALTRRKLNLGHSAPSVKKNQWQKMKEASGFSAHSPLRHPARLTLIGQNGRGLRGGPCEGSPRSIVEVQGELEGGRPQAGRLDLVLFLPLDPAVDHVLGEHVPLA